MTYRWLLAVDDAARKHLRRLPSRDRMAVFRSIAELCTADDPYLLPHVTKLRETRFEGMYRRRQGMYRIFFFVTPGAVEEQKHLYDGILSIEAVLHRKDAYR